MFDRIKKIFNTKEDGRDGFTKWSKRILEISEFISKNNKLPKQNNNDKNEYNLYQSYSVNRRKFFSKELSNKQLIFLRKHKIDFEDSPSFSGRDGFTKWSKRILEISEFISKNNRFPKANKNDKNEYNLYQSYCANKRKFYAKELSPKQQRYLEQHNIILENNISISDRWQNKVLEISDFIKEHGFSPRASTHNKLYHALARIRRAKEKGKLSDEQLEFLEQHNIILENNISISDRWQNKVLEISDFIKEHGFSPRASTHNKLYHALARIRRAKEKGKLSDEQLEFLEQHNIILENNKIHGKYSNNSSLNEIKIERINNEEINIDSEKCSYNKFGKRELKIQFESDVIDFFDIEKTNINPFKVKDKLNGLEFNIFLKNISPAYFSNKNVSRIQIARTTHFKEIKKKQEICIPIGYDMINETYIVWNPFLFLERINKKNNISIYSRFTSQKDAVYNRWVELVLSSHEKLYCVNKNYIADFIINFDQFFQDINTNKLLDNDINHNLQKGFISNSNGLNDVRRLINERKFIDASNLFAELAFQENIKDFKKIRREYNKFCDTLD